MVTHMKVTLLCENGVQYRFPTSPEEICPCDMRRMVYRKTKANGHDFGQEHVFILGFHPIDAYKLLDAWNRKNPSQWCCTLIKDFA